MCGIAGVMTLDGRPPAQRMLTRLAEALRHRGPDGNGQCIQDGVALVHTRLSIIDLAHGSQPLSGGNADAVTLVANAEIYNDPALRGAMPSAVFKTGSDCESPLQVYLRDGEDFADALRGMYAIAIHDSVRRRLLLARDPFGIKPLYYAETSEGFFFASEPQALIAAGVVEAKINAGARDELLAFNFSTGNETPFARIYRVAPGETLIVERGRIAARRRRYAVPKEPARPSGEVEAIAAFDHVWHDTVSVHQRSDVPYGMFLSGGTDSAAVLAMMARLNSQPVTAFTAAFPGTATHDERGAARAAAKAAGARHVEIEITADDFWSHLPAIAAALDDPTIDYAAVPTFLLARAAARDVKVVLTGEGGDELFAGYGRTRAALRSWPFAKKPWRRHILAGFPGLRTKPAGWRDGMEAIEREAATLYGHGLKALQAIDCAGWLPNDLLLKVDRCLMAHGVEGRVPFLDPAVAAFAFPLPDRQKIRGRRGKWLLRQWLAENFPAADAFARKRGFTVPVAEWIAGQGSRLGALVARQAGVRELCVPGSVEALFAAVTPRNAPQAWTLLFYALWHQRHIIGVRTDGDVFSALADAS